MSRNSSGTYTLPTGNPVVSGTIIEASWANGTLSDIAAALTDSLSRSGQGGMTAPFRLIDGTVSAPAFAFANETGSGAYRAAAGDWYLTVLGQNIARLRTTGVDVTGTLGVTGATTLSSTLAVTGLITATGGVSGNLTGNVTGNASTATTLQTARTINGTSFNGSANITTNSWGTARTLSFTGDATGSGSVDGSANVATALTLAASGVSAGTYGGNNSIPSLVVDAKGRVTGASAVTPSGTWGISVSGNAATVTNGVYTTGDQTIGGVKRFSSSIAVGGANSPVTNLDVQTTGADALTSTFTTGVSDLNFRAGFMNGVAGSTGSMQARVGLFYLGQGEVATIGMYRGGGATDGSLALRTAGNDRLTVTSAGRVGIGVGSPDYFTHFLNSSANSVVLGLSSGSSYTEGHGPSLLFRNGVAEELASIKGALDATGNGNYGRLSFFVRTSDAAGILEKARINNNGQQSSVIPGGSTLYPEYKCRAWVNFNGTGTVAIRASGNVSSITDNGTGDYTVNFTTAMPDANYCPVLGSGDIALGGAWDYTANTYQILAGSVRVRGVSPSGTLVDPIFMGVSIFR